jgi:uncharacterized protein YcbX
VAAQFAPRGAATRFADAFPLLVVGRSSLDELERRLARPLAMRRFRPNIVVGGSEAHAEDDWRRIVVHPLTGGEASVELVFGKECSRCQVTTIDPDTGMSDGNEPLATLARYRTREFDHGGGFRERGVFFGANYVPASHGRVERGARIEVLDGATS